MRFTPGKGHPPTPVATKVTWKLSTVTIQTNVSVSASFKCCIVILSMMASSMIWFISTIFMSYNFFRAAPTIATRHYQDTQLTSELYTE